MKRTFSTELNGWPFKCSALFVKAQVSVSFLSIPLDFLVVAKFDHTRKSEKEKRG
jgi:hypothetical protein